MFAAERWKRLRRRCDRACYSVRWRRGETEHCQGDAHRAKTETEQGAKIKNAALRIRIFFMMVLSALRNLIGAKGKNRN
jgi:hypothetical protein